LGEPLFDIGVDLSERPLLLAVRVAPAAMPPLAPNLRAAANAFQARSVTTTVSKPFTMSRERPSVRNATARYEK
jgi:hypothetical protein